MVDRGTIRRFRHRNLVEPLLEDRFDRGVIAGLDLQRAQRGRLEPLSTKALLKPDDPKTRAVALLGVWPSLDDLLDQRR